MFDAVTWLAMGGSLIAHTLAAIFFKIAAQQNTRKRILGYFIFGNCVGFFNPLCLTIALRGNHPNLVMAGMGGVGAAFFVIVLNRVFKERLTPRQWAALGIIMAGTILLQLGSNEPVEIHDLKQSSGESVN